MGKMVTFSYITEYLIEYACILTVNIFNSLYFSVMLWNNRYYNFDWLAAFTQQFTVNKCMLLGTVFIVLTNLTQNKYCVIEHTFIGCILCEESKPSKI
jgi:hypothetical protein